MLAVLRRFETVEHTKWETQSGVYANDEKKEKYNKRRMYAQQKQKQKKVKEGEEEEEKIGTQTESIY